MINQTQLSERKKTLYPYVSPAWVILQLRMANGLLVLIALFNIISPIFGACPPGFIAYDGDIPGPGLFSEYIANLDKCAHDCKKALGCESFSHSLTHNGCKLMYGSRPTGPKSGDYQFCSNLGCTDTPVSYTHLRAHET